MGRLVYSKTVHLQNGNLKYQVKILLTLSYVSLEIDFVCGKSYDEILRCLNE
ncbi:MAG: hypothetical protein ACI4KE_03230 [Anaerovoracaceae bacterium]